MNLFANGRPLIDLVAVLPDTQPTDVEVPQKRLVSWWGGTIIAGGKEGRRVARAAIVLCSPYVRRQTSDMRSGKMSNEERYGKYCVNVTAAISRHPESISFKNIDLVFFPIVEAEHF
ncbi:uncharacterized protein LOC112504428 [Cynara cardunculus var. scolymus]|uniref:uncharacterized protein LOC112504428 n=1 Tax=Cynara cardunculus var. scolymus TaxID=59895 RepID=UPI000D624DDF|nr:uncharacterized protein LOC112504428 [Cynara cardunculus var. scolymus]